MADTNPGGTAPAADDWLRAMPMVFVLIWSTGFIVARYGMPHAPPIGFLSLRYALSLLCFLPWILWARARWPQGRAQWLHLGVTGVLMHAGYLGGVWAAVKAGIGAGTVALIVGLQPLLTAWWVARQGAGAVAHERVSRRQWLGLLLGFGGLGLVVWHKLGVGEVRADNLALALLALGCITVGTLYQKRHVRPCDARTANTVQLLAALTVSAPLAWLEGGAWDWHPEMLAALAWSVVALTLGASSLLYLLIQRGAATRVTSLLYLVPPCTALMGWWLFDEALSALTLLGMGLTVLGVAWVLRGGGR